MQDGAVAAKWPDIRVSGLIGLGHGCSHFFQLVLPPLFPFIIVDFDIGFTEVGVLMTVVFVTSGLCQFMAGFVVDRWGARRVLLSGFALDCAAIAGFATLTEFWMFFPMAVLLGIGNSVFHPADFTVLNNAISPKRLGRAFGAHTFGGNLGWALATPLMFAIGSFYHWRTAILVAAAIGAAIWLLLWFNRRDLVGGGAPKRQEEGTAETSGFAPMMSMPVIYCFLFFVLLALSLIAVQDFLPLTLLALHGTALEIGAQALSGFLLGSAAGVIIGGVLADRTSRHSLTISLGLLGSAMLFLLAGFVSLPTLLIVAAVSFAGVLSGLTTPSRDMLVRSATPAGATGRVYGFVYSGLDVGSALAPATVGILLDGGEPLSVMLLIAGVLVLAIFTVVSIRPRARLAMAE